MSADLYFSEVNDREYGSLHISMNVHGYLFIHVTSKGASEEAAIETFCLPSNAEGIQEAQFIINALKEWIERVKEIGPL